MTSKELKKEKRAITGLSRSEFISIQVHSPSTHRKKISYILEQMIYLLYWYQLFKNCQDDLAYVSETHVKIPFFSSAICLADFKSSHNET